jgi:hypothetical protein
MDSIQEWLYTLQGMNRGTCKGLRPVVPLIMSVVSDYEWDQKVVATYGRDTHASAAIIISVFPNTLRTVHI